MKEIVSFSFLLYLIRWNILEIEKLSSRITKKKKKKRKEGKKKKKKNNGESESVVNVIFSHEIEYWEESERT